MTKEERMEPRIALGRLAPEDFSHTTKYPLLGAIDAPPSAVVETDRRTRLPKGLWESTWQGSKNGCVGASLTQAMSYYNSVKKFKAYDWYWLWCRACAIDTSPRTDCAANTGSYLRVGFDVLRKEGHSLVRPSGVVKDPNLKHGIVENRWCDSVDQIRAALVTDPVVMGSDWPDVLSRPTKRGDEYWMPASYTGPAPSMGHAYTLFDWSDEREAAWCANTWAGWPDSKGSGVWFPATLLGQLLAGRGEGGVCTDKPSVPK